MGTTNSETAIQYNPGHHKPPTNDKRCCPLPTQRPCCVNYISSPLGKQLLPFIHIKNPDGTCNFQLQTRVMMILS